MVDVSGFPAYAKFLEAVYDTPQGNQRLIMLEEIIEAAQLLRQIEREKLGLD